MEKFAIIKFGGKQFLVQEGDRITLEHQKSLVNEVLLFSDGNVVLVGNPTVEGVKVKAEFVKNAPEHARKIRVARFRNKSRSRRVKGHTQPISVVRISSITNGDEEKPAKVEKAPVKKTAIKKTTAKKSVKSSVKKAKK